MSGDLKVSYVFAHLAKLRCQLSLFWTKFTRMPVQQTALGIGDSVSLWSKEQASLLSSIINILFLSRGRSGRLIANYKSFGFSQLRVLVLE